MPKNVWFLYWNNKHGNIERERRTTLLRVGESKKRRRIYWVVEQKDFGSREIFRNCKEPTAGNPAAAPFFLFKIRKKMKLGHKISRSYYIKKFLARSYLGGRPEQDFYMVLAKMHVHCYSSFYSIVMFRCS